MSFQSEFRASAVALAAVFCLGSIGYRVLTAPQIPDLAPTIARVDTALKGMPVVLSHVQATSDAATGLLRSATPVVAGLKVTEGKLNEGIDLTSHRINDLCAPGPCGTLADTNRTLATLRGTSGQVELSLRKFNQHEDALFVQESDAYTTMQKSVADFDTLLQQSQPVVANATEITAQAAIIARDAKVEEQKYVYPPNTPWYKKILPTALKLGELTYDFVR